MVAMWQLIRAVVELLAMHAANPLDHAVLQTVFGMIVTRLIAMEFKHSIMRVILRRSHIVHGQDGSDGRLAGDLPEVHYS